MVESEDTPSAGYRLEDVYFLEQRYESVEADDEIEDEGERQLRILWDWRIVEAEEGEPRVIEVRLGLKLSPEKDLPYRVSVDVVGRFNLYGEQSLAIEDFVCLSGPASLFPYAREKISSLTSSGPYQAHHLPFINVVRLMEGMDLEDTTGAEQLEELRAAKKTGDAEDGGDGS